MKVVEYWHGTIKNYRYDGDVLVTSIQALTLIQMTLSLNLNTY